MRLLRHLTRAVPWIPWLPCAALVAVLLWGADSLLPDFAGRQLYIRAALLVAALGLSFVYDDPGAETIDPSPSPLRRRRVGRTVIGVVPWGILVVTVLIITGRGMEPTFILSDEIPNPFPIGRVLLEASTMATWGLAIAAVISKRWDEEPGKVASAGLLALYAASWVVPEQYKPWANPNDQRWESALPWWWATFAIGLLIVVAFSWDSRVGMRMNVRSRAPTMSPSTGVVDADSGNSGR